MRTARDPTDYKTECAIQLNEFSHAGVLLCLDPRALSDRIGGGGGHANISSHVECRCVDCRCAGRARCPAVMLSELAAGLRWEEWRWRPRPPPLPL